MTKTARFSATALIVLVLLHAAVASAFGQLRSAAVIQFNQAAPLGEAAQSVTLASPETSHWLAGGIIGAVVGGVTTAVIVHSGGSTSLCDRSANQDAMSSGECLGLTVGGALVGGALGAFIGSRIHSGGQTENRELRVAPLPDGRVLIRTRISL